MTFEELLNQDVGAVGEGLRRGLRWWAAELAELMPTSWRPVSGAGAMLDLRDPTLARLWRNGRATNLTTAPKGGARSAAVGVSPSLVLRREITLPALRMDDLWRLVENDIDRLTPLRSDEVYFDLAPNARPIDAERQTAQLAVIRRGDAEAAVARAIDLGVSPRRLGVAEDGGNVAFDFLPAIRSADRAGRQDWTPLLWWTALGVCLALNLGVMVFKDSFDVASLRGVVELQQPSVDLAFRLRQRIESEAAARQALVTRRGHNDPLRILDAVTRVLPPPQSLERLEFNGRAVRLVGFRDPRFDVLAALQNSRVMTRPRSASSGETAAAATMPSFDVVADVAGDGGR